MIDSQKYLYTAMLATVLAFSAAAAHAATVKADYQFQDTFSSSVSGAPDLTVVGGGTPGSFQTQTVDGQSRTVYAFNGTVQNATGLRAETDGLISASTYSIVMYAQLNTLDSDLGKLIDFKNLTSDAGLYDVSNIPAFYDATTQVGTGLTPFPVDGTFAQLVLTRDASGTVNVYLNGTPQFNFDDSTSALAVIDDPNSAAEYLHFFIDDTQNTIVTNGLQLENATGSIARLRLYDGALSGTEVANLDTVPEPASAFATIALCTASLTLRRRRRRVG